MDYLLTPTFTADFLVLKKLSVIVYAEFWLALYALVYVVLADEIGVENCDMVLEPSAPAVVACPFPFLTGSGTAKPY